MRACCRRYGTPARTAPGRSFGSSVAVSNARGRWSKGGLSLRKRTLSDTSDERTGLPGAVFASPTVRLPPRCFGVNGHKRDHFAICFACSLQAHEVWDIIFHPAQYFFSSQSQCAPRRVRASGAWAFPADRGPCPCVSATCSKRRGD